MKKPIRNERRVDEEAAAWLEALAGGGQAERAAFAEWIRESPRHVRAFLLMTALDRELEGVDGDRKQRIELVSASVIPLTGASEQAQGAKRRRAAMHPLRWAAGIAAVALLGTLLAILRPPGYSTAVGEQRTFDLSDGSVVYLNTNSDLEIDFSGTARDIRLLKGEALFRVAKDAARPFRVHSDDTVIQAVGTEFNVRRDSQGTRVAVIEGQIKVGDQPQPLSAGEAATIPRAAGVVERVRADVPRTLAWRQRRLMFRSDTLSDIAAEFNRYNRAPRIRVEDESVGNRRFSGVFDADDPESLVQVLDGDDGLQVQRSDRELLIKNKTPAGLPAGVSR